MVSAKKRSLLLLLLVPLLPLNRLQAAQKSHRKRHALSPCPRVRRAAANRRRQPEQRQRGKPNDMQIERQKGQVEQLPLDSATRPNGLDAPPATSDADAHGPLQPALIAWRLRSCCLAWAQANSLTNGMGGRPPPRGCRKHWAPRGGNGASDWKLAAGPRTSLGPL